MRKKKASLSPGVLLARVFWLGVAGGAAWCGFEQYRLGEWPWLRRSAGLGGIQLLKRSEWSAVEPREAMGRMVRPERVTLHHSGGGVMTSESRDAAARAIKAMQTEHIERRRWSDLGYHYIVDRAGRVWEGRRADRVGAHAGNAAANERNLGVVLLGNFDQQSPSAAQKASLDRLVTALRARYSIPRTKVLSHSEVRDGCGLGPTNCPGKHLSEWLAAYRRGAEKKPTSASGPRTALLNTAALSLALLNGLTDHQEYFAERTEAYFYRKDFYPFVRAELKEHEPLLHELLVKIWGPAE